MNYGYLETMLTTAKDQLMWQITNIAMCSDMLGISISIDKSYARSVESIHTRRARAIASATVSPFEGVMRTGQQLVNLIPVGDDVEVVHGINQTAGQAVTSGFRSAGKSFVGAITGIVKDPIRESKNPAYKNKFVGVMAGIGKGLAGIVVRPIQGVMGVTTGIATGIRKKVEGDQTVFKRQRTARAFPKRHIIPYYPESALFQAMVECQSSGEIIENIYELVNGHQVVITNQFIMIFALVNNAWEIQRHFHIAHIKGMTQRAESVSVIPSNGKEIIFNHISPSLALDFSKRIKSRVCMARIFT